MLKAIDVRCRGHQCDRRAQCARASDLSTASLPWTPFIDRMCDTWESSGRFVTAARSKRPLYLRFMAMEKETT